MQNYTIESFKKQVEAVKIAINLGLDGFLMEQPQTDYPLAACDAAALLTGVSTTFARMYNKKWRDAAFEWMFQKSLKEVGGYKPPPHSASWQ